MVLNSNDIISRLKNKNMSFADENKAKDFFDTNSYYRFRGYFYYLLDAQSTQSNQHGKKFITQVSFEHIKEIYDFDIFLRGKLFNGLQLVEIALKQRILKSFALIYGKIGYLNEQNFNVQNRLARQQFRKMIKRMLFVVTKSMAPYLQQYTFTDMRQYPFDRQILMFTEQQIPLWKVLEVCDFGIVANFIALLNQPQKKDISTFFKYPSDRYFIGHIHALNTLRNKCAHHEQLFNRCLVQQRNPNVQNNINIPAFFEVQYGQRNRVYNALCILIYFLQSIKETCKKDIYQGIKKYDSILNHLPSGYGFFDNWQQDTFWTN